MKKLIVLFIVAISVASCKKSDDADPEIPVVVDTTNVLKYSGSFTSTAFGHVMGDAKIYKRNGKYVLVLENFKSSNGPNLHVYLSKEETPINFKDLGTLKSLGGDQEYDINENLDVSPYSYVCIYCVDQSQVFGYANY